MRLCHDDVIFGANIERRVAAGAETVRRRNLHASTPYSFFGVKQTEASIQAFFLAMALHPDVQKKAQAELDEVIGSGRLPDFSDRQSLPYVNALIMELVRWHIVTPTGLPHTTTQDDEYNGYFIPKGSVIVPNVW